MKKIAIFILAITIIFSLAFYFLNQKETKTMNQTGNSNPTNPNETSTIKQLNMTEVATHNTKDSCYLVIQNKVYDVSSFISKHPGGQQKIISNCGKEVSGLFASIHSNAAWDLLKNYQIGEIK